MMQHCRSSSVTGGRQRMERCSDAQVCIEVYGLLDRKQTGRQKTKTWLGEPWQKIRGSVQDQLYIQEACLTWCTSCDPQSHIPTVRDSTGSVSHVMTVMWPSVPHPHGPWQVASIKWNMEFFLLRTRAGLDPRIDDCTHPSLRCVLDYHRRHSSPK